ANAAKEEDPTIGDRTISRANAALEGMPGVTLLGEFAHSDSAGGGGNAARAELRAARGPLHFNAFAVEAGDNFSNPASGFPRARGGGPRRRGGGAGGPPPACGGGPSAGAPETRGVGGRAAGPASPAASPTRSWPSWRSARPTNRPRRPTRSRPRRRAPRRTTR